MRAAAVAWQRWRLHTEAEAEKAMQAKLSSAMHGRDRMIGFMKRMLNSRSSAPSFEVIAVLLYQRERVHAANVFVGLN